MGGQQKTKNFFYRMLCGFFLGISVIAPGVSGSIMAVMMGIYDRLITIISNPFKNFKRNVIYLIPMGIGALLSVVLLIQVFNWLFDIHAVPGYLLFMGLIGGSISTVYKEASGDGVKKRYMLVSILTSVFAATLGILSQEVTASSMYITNPFYFSMAGLIAGVASMVPGMSISMLLMLLGVYRPMLDATSRFDVIAMAPVGICFVIGMILFSRLIKYVFKKYHNFAYFAVFGFMIGTLIGIFPGVPQGVSEWVLSIIMVSIGIGISYLFQILGNKFNKAEQAETA